MSYQLPAGMSETQQWRTLKSIMKHLVVSLGVLVFALMLVGGGVGLFFLNSIGRADERLYVVGVENLGVMAEVREEFNTLPIHMRSMIIESNPDRMGDFLDGFNEAKGLVTDKLEQIGRVIAGDPEKEGLAGKMNDQLGAYWAEADKFASICLANKKPEATQYMRERAYPAFQASLQAMGFLQEKMKGDAYAQVKSNRTIIISASVAMAACILVMGVLAIVFAVRIMRLT